MGKSRSYKVDIYHTFIIVDDFNFESNASVCVKPSIIMTHLLHSKTSGIILLEGKDNYTNIHFANGDQVLSSYTLRKHQDLLNSFVRVNRKYLVNPEYIVNYNVKDVMPHVLLTTGIKIKIPRRKVKTIV